MTFCFEQAGADINVAMDLRMAMLCLALGTTANAGERLGNWTGNYAPCDQHREVLKREHMDLRVRFSTSNRVLAAEFARAMDFWARILEMNWHQDNSRDCALQVIDGHPSLFKEGEVARAQFPGLHSFQGCIAFDPKRYLPAADLFSTAVHELGHIFGLSHSSDVSSVMYFLRVDGRVFLDAADLAALATRHKLRTLAAPEVLVAVQ